MFDGIIQFLNYGWWPIYSFFILIPFLLSQPSFYKSQLDKTHIELNLCASSLARSSRALHKQSPQLICIRTSRRFTGLDVGQRHPNDIQTWVLSHIIQHRQLCTRDVRREIVRKQRKWFVRIVPRAIVRVISRWLNQFAMCSTRERGRDTDTTDARPWYCIVFFITTQPLIRIRGCDF